MRDGRGGILLAGIAVFLLGFLLSAARGFNSHDEAWFLQVAHRVASGEVLYRDVFFGATPLSVYVTAAGVRLFGTEILVVKAVLALCFALTVLLAWQVDRQLGARGFPLLPVLALLVYGRPEGGAAAPYTALATLLFMACFSATLWWLQAEQAQPGGRRAAASAVPLAVAGLAAGLSFASKQNLGLYALAALALTVMAGSAGVRAAAARGLLAGGTFLAAGLLPLASVWLSGAVGEFVEYGFASRGIYLAHARISYLDGLTRLAQLAVAPWSWGALKEIYELQRFVLPPAAGAVLAAAWLRAGPRECTTAATVLLFVGAGFLGVFPRADSAHLIPAMPQLVVGLAYGLRRLWPDAAAPWKRLAGAGLLAWLGLGLAVLLIQPVVRAASGSSRISAVPHFRGPLISASRQAEILAHARALDDAAGAGTFLLMPEAGLYYLITGLKNPTPFDYPYVTAFGRRGQQQTMAAIATGRIRTVCLAASGPPPLRPVDLERYVQEQMEPGPDVGVCRLYRRRA